MHPYFYSSIIYNSNNIEAAQLSINWWIKIWYIYNGIWPLKKILPSPTTCMELEPTRLSEINRKRKKYMISLTWNLRDQTNEQRWKKKLLQSYNNQTVWFWLKNRCRLREQSRESRNKPVYMCSIYDKGAENLRWEKDSLFNKCRRNWIAKSKRMKLDSCFTLYAKVSSKGI